MHEQNYPKNPNYHGHHPHRPDIIDLDRAHAIQRLLDKALTARQHYPQNTETYDAIISELEAERASLTETW
jgi:hypothetical protein